MKKVWGCRTPCKDSVAYSFESMSMTVRRTLYWTCWKHQQWRFQTTKILYQGSHDERRQQRSSLRLPFPSSVFTSFLLLYGYNTVFVSSQSVIKCQLSHPWRHSLFIPQTAKLCSNSSIASVVNVPPDQAGMHSEECPEVFCYSVAHIEIAIKQASSTLDLRGQSPPLI